MTPIQECELLPSGICEHRNARKGSFLRRLGPGFVTGASDDDPSGLATYAQAGAQMGSGILWFALWTLPLMVSVQEMAGRIGLMTQGGLTTVLLQKFSRTIVMFMVG